MISDGATSNRAGLVAFSDIQRVLSLFTQGLAGGALPLKPIEPRPPGGDLTRTLSDSGTIHLPAKVNDFTSSRHNFGVYRVAILRQISYRTHGTLSFTLAVAFARMPQLMLPMLRRARALRKASPSSAAPTSDLALFFAGWARPVLLRRIFVLLESARIDTVIFRCYPGAQADLKRVRTHALSARPPLRALRPVPALIESLVQLSLGADPTALQELDRTGILAWAMNLVTSVRTKDASVYDSARAAIEICLRIDALIQPRTRQGIARDFVMVQPSPNDDTSETGLSDQWIYALNVDSPDVQNEMNGAGINADVASTFDFVSVSRGTGGSGTPLELPAPLSVDSSAELPAKQYRNATSPSFVPPGSFPVPALGRQCRAYLYDEWNYIDRTYLKAWCRVIEQRLDGDNLDFLATVHHRHKELARQMRWRLNYIHPQSYQRVHRAAEGEELDLDRIIEAVIDHRAGHDADGRHYIRRERNRRDMGAAFLIDMSASTDFPVPEPGAPSTAAEAGTEASEDFCYFYGAEDVSLALDTTAKRRVIDVSKEAMVLMSNALHELGDSHAIYGFSSDGRDNVEFYVAKEFSDTWSQRAAAALAAMQPRRSTRTGAAIRHAVAKLARQPERTKILMVISDGYPEDRDYGPQPRDLEYGIEDTARALQEAERAGISTFCISIDLARHDYLRRMCPEQRYMAIDDVADLPAQLAKIYGKLSASRKDMRLAHYRT